MTLYNYSTTVASTLAEYTCWRGESKTFFTYFS